MTRIHISLFSPLVLPLLILIAPVANAQQTPVDELKKWLASDDRAAIDQQSWAKQAISKQQAVEAKELLWNDYVEQIKADRKEEWEKQVIELDDLKMKFEFKTFGEANETGRSLFISMHGGGGAPARVNEQQWRNQIGLYEPEEGVYLAPRAPTNTWNLWHQAHIDKFFERIIQNAVVFEGVDPNRVYIMGYSAGGDGVYQLAPRMADRLAAAAMMAGHPNGVSPLGLRNIGFTLHMGGNDAAYNRNKIAAKWKVKLADLQKADPEGYQHEVVIYEGKGHWMDREDAVAVPWMSRFVRDPLPAKIVWHQLGVTYQQFYWLAVDDENKLAGGKVIAEVEGQTISILETEKIDRVKIRLSDELVDMDQPIVIKVGDETISTVVPERTIGSLSRTLQERGDVNLMFSAETSVELAK